MPLNLIKKITFSIAIDSIKTISFYRLKFSQIRLHYKFKLFHTIPFNIIYTDDI